MESPDLHGGFSTPVTRKKLAIVPNRDRIAEKTCDGCKHEAIREIPLKEN